MHSQVCTIEAIADDANMNLFCKLANPRHCVHSLLPPIKSCNHSLRQKDIYMNCPDVTLRCIKSHLYHIVFISTCNVFNPFLCSFLSYTVYFHCLPLHLLRVTLNINQSHSKAARKAAALLNRLANLIACQ